jgi:pyruvate/2-oxoglutarate dehydrogenase complex dihydrolipoamide dehydrogenase (E3) component
VIVIGGGPVGENVADRVTRGGPRAAIVEQVGFGNVSEVVGAPGPSS